MITITADTLERAMRKYQFRALAVLIFSVISCVLFDYYLVSHAIDIGLEYYPRHGFVWPTIIMGFYLLFVLSCYVIKGVLTELFVKND